MSSYHIISGTGDYHNEMNSAHFEEWWETKVLPSLPDKLVVVIDNATYHSRQTDESKTPTRTWKKAELQTWLQCKNIAFDKKDTKTILLHKLKEIVVEKKYVLETITALHCVQTNKRIEIIRLPQLGIRS